MRTSDLVAARAIERMARYAHSSSGEAPDFPLTGTAAISEVERKLQSWYGVSYALCVSNATDALRSIALAVGLRNAEFVTTPLTWGGSIAEWLRLGNRPRFVALDPATLTLSPDAVRLAITPHTQAILSVDIFRNPADMIALRDIADEYHLWFISDASQSLGAYRAGRPASSLADAWVLSFGVGKGIDAGDGGAVLTNNHELYEKLVWETQHPVRHRIELGLSLDNEFACNGRMNPWTAIWLAETFDAQMETLLERQAELSAQVNNAWRAGIARGAVADGAIKPSFQRVVLSWCAAEARDDLVALFFSAGRSASITQLPVRPLFGQPSFVAQYLKRSSGTLDEQALGADLSRYFCVEVVSEEADRCSLA